jgi:uncharacterized membrane protein YdjX (TVP38/TMEM64 family)
MKRIWLTVVAMLVFCSALFVAAEQAGWLAPAVTEQFLARLHASPRGQVGVALAVAGLLAVDVLLPIPSSLVMALAGKLLGPVTGGLAACLGAGLSAAIGYGACRWGGERAFRRLVGDRDTARLRAWFERYGVYAIVLSRPVPMLTEILSCLAGLAAMPVRPFALAAALGTVPICFVYSYVGSRGDLRDPWPAIWIALVIPALGWLFVRRLHRPPTAPEPPHA